jgi:hypothetical protein
MSRFSYLVGRFSGGHIWPVLGVPRGSDDADRLVFGKIDNEPVVITTIHLGMDLAISYDNIREQMRSESFGQ